MALHSVVLTLVLPLWIAAQTSAPQAVVSAVLVTNAILTVLLTVRISAQAENALTAARAMRRAGLVLAVAMLLYPVSAWLGTGGSVALLLATVVYTVGDLFHATAAAGLAYELARPDALGQYQGVNGLVNGLAQAVGPAVLTLLLIHGRAAGWIALAVVLVAAGLATPVLTRHALGSHPPYQTPAAPVVSR
ncbi:MFS transporter [Micromonospora sp. AMSO12t]|uniref:MFS transporter n=1 Tax=Micromonospora sp. AMSO12t TaxID=2650410 RepID=UPI00124B9C9F|nr:MFS transporter [Micromonospora sp. AMSO12t]KAB1161309.1 MFS transporter [Micromonospora sp. AMSO12t]